MTIEEVVLELGVDATLEERLRMYCTVRIEELRRALLKVPLGTIHSSTLEARVVAESKAYKNILKFLDFYCV
jgi:hypothetical protein